MDATALPHPGVQAMFWYVVGALVLLAAAAVALRLFSRWVSNEIAGIVQGSIDVKGAVAEALREHEAREARWREEDRKEWRDDLREVRGKVDRILEHWLDKALTRLGDDKPITGG